MVALVTGANRHDVTQLLSLIDAMPMPVASELGGELTQSCDACGVDAGVIGRARGPEVLAPDAQTALSALIAIKCE